MVEYVRRHFADALIDERRIEYMTLAGIQKLTLLDYPGKVACIVFTPGCNFRCPFCHNASLVTHTSDTISLDEGSLFDLLKKRSGVLEGVVITGGEPLLHADLPELMREIKRLGYMVKLDTNGTDPERLSKLIDEHLCDYVAMDVKNPLKDYAAATGLLSVDTVALRRSIDLLISGTVDYEFRTTAVKGIHTRDSIEKIAREIAGARSYFLQTFKDSGDLVAPRGLSAFSAEEMEDLCEAAKKYLPNVGIRGI